MATNLELSEALKQRFDAEIARMITESVSMPPDIARKADVAAVGAEVNVLRGEVTDLRGQFTELRGEVTDLRGQLVRLGDRMEAGFLHLEQVIEAKTAGVEARLMRWMLTFFVPLWLGVWAVVLALVFGN